jgi:hypothetical protein
MDLQTLKIVVLIVIPFVIFTVGAVVHAAQQDFGTGGRKAMWMLVASIPFVGFVVYFIFGARRGKTAEKQVDG